MDKQLRTQIRLECIELSNAFAYHTDRGNYRELAELFAEDGVWIRNGVPLRGRAAILGELNERKSDRFMRHVTTGHHFTEIGPDTAAATAYNMTYYSMDNSGVSPRPFVPEQAILFDFTDTYVRTPEGWRFASRASAPVLLPAAARASFQPSGAKAE